LIFGVHFLPVGNMILGSNFEWREE